MFSYRENNNSPVFCDHCPTLAMAELHDAPLCQACLLAEIAILTVDEMEEGIQPLHFEEASVDSGPRRSASARKVA